MGCVNSTTASTMPVTVASGAPTGTGEYDFKPFHSAVRWGKLPEVLKLMKDERSVDCADVGNGNRPIHIAAQNGHLDILKALIKAKCNIDSKNGKGNTALHMAIGYDYYECAVAIIEAKGDLTLTNDAAVPASRGLEGDKSLATIAFICAKTDKEASTSLAMCLENPLEVNKVSFVSSGLKLKKTLGAAWTQDMDKNFKKVIELIRE